jgi:DNA-binding CsgD family transcriptional regulator
MGSNSKVLDPSLSRQQWLSLNMEVELVLQEVDRQIQRLRASLAVPPAPEVPSGLQPDEREGAGRPEAGGDAGSGLTDREAQALGLLSQGLTAAAVARRMGCSTSMVNKHLGSLYRKLGVADRLGAVLAAQRMGLIRPHGPDAVGSSPGPVGRTAVPAGTGGGAPGLGRG